MRIVGRLGTFKGTSRCSMNPGKIGTNFLGTNEGIKVSVDVSDYNRSGGNVKSSEYTQLINGKL